MHRLNDIEDASPSRSSQSNGFGESDKAIIVESLLKFGAQPDTYNSEGLAALHVAIRGGHADVAKKLLQGGANANICDTKVRNSVFLVEQKIVF